MIEARVEDQSARRRLTSILSCVFAILILSPAASAQQGDPLQGDPFKGRELLRSKLCTQCHSVWGHGGDVGPDLSVAVGGKNWLELVGDFWNHTPRMIDAIGTKGHKWPTLDRGEMAAILSYLYYLRLFDEPGNAGRGSAAFFRLRCSSCHSLGGEGGTGGGSLDKFSTFTSPVSLAQAMWNAGPTMQRLQLQSESLIPRFTGNEIAHVQAYIRSRGIRNDREVKLLALPDPVRGARVFELKSCSRCHQGRRGVGPDLRASNKNLSVSAISGILWNHSYVMFDKMQALGISFPTFNGNEMADLISYLHFLGFFSEAGDPVQGAAVLKVRGCAQCHEGEVPGAIDLATSKAASDPVSLAAAMWNHAPAMHKRMASLGITWPKFAPGEMEDLVAYLRDLTRLRTSGVGGRSRPASGRPEE